MQGPWSETPVGGSPEAERRRVRAPGARHHARPAHDAKTASAHGVPHGVDRAFHAKSTLAVDDAELRFLDDLPADLQAGFAQPGRGVPRPRSGSPTPRASPSPTPSPTCAAWRCACRCRTRRPHDLLMTNFPVSHARDARQFVEFAKRHRRRRRLAAARHRCGWSGCSALRETMRMLKNVLTARGAPAEQRGHRDVLEPRRAALGADARGALPAAARARHGAGAAPADGRPELPLDRGGAPPAPPATSASSCASSATSTTPSTPIEDTAVEWTEQRLAAGAGRGAHHPAAATSARSTRMAQARAIDALAFNPWNTTDEFRPLGNLNRARKAVYDASAAHRLRLPLADASRRCATRSLGAAARAAFCRRQPVRRVAPAAGPARPAQPRGLPATCCASENLIDTELARGAAGRAAGAARPRRTRRRASRAPSTARDNDLSAPGDGRGRRGVRPQPAAGLPARPVRRAEPGRGQPAAAAPRAVPAGPLAEPARRRLDPVPGARLGRPRPRTRSARTTCVVPLPGGHDLVEHARTARRSSEMRIAGNIPLADGPAEPDGARSSPTPPRTGGTARRCTAPTRTKARPAARGREAAAHRRRLPARGRSAGMEITGFNESWWLGPEQPAHAVRARAQRALRRAPRALPAAGATSASTRRRG